REALLRSYKLSPGLPQRRRESWRDRGARRRRGDVRPAIGGAGRDRSTPASVGPMRKRSRGGASRRRHARSLPGVRAGRARSRRARASPSTDSVLPPEVRGPADGRGVADRRPPPAFGIERGAGPRDLAGRDRMDRPGARPHTPGAGAHENPGASFSRRRAGGFAPALVDRVSRFACVLVEYFDAAAVERGEPALRAQPLGVVNVRVDRPSAGSPAPKTALVGGGN